MVAANRIDASILDHEASAPSGPPCSGLSLAMTPLWLNAASAAVGALVVRRDHQSGALPRFGAAMAVGAAVQGVFTVRMGNRLGVSSLTTADVLTLGRATFGATLLALVAAGARDRSGPVGRAAFAAVLLATLADWVDGPVARRLGPTRLGAVLDIEADSLLTVGAAAAAVVWGGLPRASLLPPILRYADPVRALRAGETFPGGGPWWCRATGTAQMALFLAALCPWRRGSDRWLRRAAAVVAGAQVATQVLHAGKRAAARNTGGPGVD